MNHPGDTGARDFMPEKQFRVRFKSGLTVTVSAKSMEEAKQKAYKQAGGKFGPQQARKSVSSVTTVG